MVLLVYVSIFICFAGLAFAAEQEVGGGVVVGPTVWINEIHYDNVSTDAGEFIEVAGAAGTNLAGWSLIGYNGGGGVMYNTIAMSGTLPDQQAGIGTLSFAFVPMQNGAPDGLALVDDTGTVVEFISYEGSMTATTGPAAGMLSTDIGVAESSGTPVGYSLQLGGSGSVSTDFFWQAEMANTSGGINTNQTFAAFVAIAAGLTGVRNGSVAWGDYDNDGDLDILLTGIIETERISRVYRNDGEPVEFLIEADSIYFTNNILREIWVFVAPEWLENDDVSLDIEITGINDGFHEHGTQLGLVSATTHLATDQGESLVSVDWNTDVNITHSPETYTACVQAMYNGLPFGVVNCTSFGPF
jgi:hypothetical protein